MTHATTSTLSSRRSDWMVNARRGDTFVYFEGVCLASLRVHDGEDSEVDQVARLAWALSVKGKVCLTQQRIPGAAGTRYRYTATRRSGSPEPGRIFAEGKAVAGRERRA